MEKTFQSFKSGKLGHHDFFIQLMENDHMLIISSSTRAKQILLCDYFWHAILKWLKTCYTMNRFVKDNYYSISIDKMHEKVYAGLFHWDDTKFAELIYFHEPQCHADDKIKVFTNSTTLFQFTKNISIINNEEFILFKSEPNGTYGNFYIDDGVESSTIEIELDKRYPFDIKFKFVGTSTRVNSAITYYLQTIYPAFSFSTFQCSFQMILCYSTCKTCVAFGDDEDHQCLTCADNHYKYLTNSSTNCYPNDDSTLLKWYLEDEIFYDCSSSCKGCTSKEIYTDSPFQLNTFCLACADNNYPYYDLPECRNNTHKELNIYLLPTVKIHYDCFKSCETCSTSEDSKSMNCDSCLPGKKYDALSKNCINENPPNSAYIGDYGESYPCYNTCDSCSKEGNDVTHNCDSCLSPFYMMKMTNDCLDPVDFRSAPGYYVDDTAKMIYLCYSSCSTCEGVGSILNHNCAECKTDFYKELNTNNCFDKNDIRDGMYINSKTSPKEWTKCKDVCKTCKDGISCITCKDKAFYYVNNCYTTCPDGTVFFENKCVSGCPEGSNPVTNGCFNMFNPSNSTDNTVKKTEIKQRRLNIYISKRSYSICRQSSNY